MWLIFYACVYWAAAKPQSEQNLLSGWFLFIHKVKQNWREKNTQRNQTKIHGWAIVIAWFRFQVQKKHKKLCANLVSKTQMKWNYMWMVNSMCTCDILIFATPWMPRRVHCTYSVRCSCMCTSCGYIAEALISSKAERAPNAILLLLRKVVSIQWSRRKETHIKNPSHSVSAMPFVLHNSLTKYHF